MGIDVFQTHMLSLNNKLIEFSQDDYIEQRYCNTWCFRREEIPCFGFHAECSITQWPSFSWNQIFTLRKENCMLKTSAYSRMITLCSKVWRQWKGLQFFGFESY